MRIGIDARLYGPRLAKGLGRYIQKLIEGLQEIDYQNQYFIFLTGDNWEECEIKNPNFQKVLAPWRWYTLAEQIQMPRILKKYHLDLVHFPHFNVPFFYRGNFIVTIHDLLLRKHNSRRASTLGPLKFWFKKRIYLRVIASAIRRAKKIIAVSEFTKSEILKYYPQIGPERIAVTYEGLTDLSSSDIQDDKQSLLKYNISKPYLLYVGNAYPHKNLENLIRAFLKIYKNWPGYLALVGKKDYFYNRLESWAKGLAKDDVGRIIFTDYIPDDDLKKVYSEAELYVFPSLCEGFGLPPLEAINNNLAVVASDIPSLREIVGSGATYFNPYSIDDMTEKIEAVIKNKNLAEDSVKNGKELIKKYNWEEMAKKTLLIYYGK